MPRLVGLFVLGLWYCVGFNDFELGVLMLFWVSITLRWFSGFRGCVYRVCGF